MAGRDALAAVLGMAVAAWTLTACSGGGRQPSSLGRPYEVTITGDSDSIVARTLSVDAEGLPQREPLFDIRTTGATEEASRRRVVVNVRYDRRATQTTFRTARNATARPQLVIDITSRDSAMLASQIAVKSATATRMIERFELYSQIAVLRRNHNAEATAEIRRMFGIGILIPADLQSSKRGRGFVWLSNNANTGLRNICVYSVSANAARRHSFAEIRDSVMRRNIPGERRGMYMTTARATVADAELLTPDRMNGGKRLRRGLWEMHGDAMGGPFTALTIDRGDDVVIVEAFVFAPERRKRDLMKPLEAAVYSSFLPEKNKTKRQ